MPSYINICDDCTFSHYHLVIISYAPTRTPGAEFLTKNKKITIILKNSKRKQPRYIYIYNYMPPFHNLKMEICIINRK